MEFLTTSEVMDELGVSRSTVARLVEQQVLNPIRFGEKGRLRFNPEEVQALLGTPK